MFPSESLVGRKLGNYRLERLLGRGGMASVYYGFDTQLERPAAVKVIDERYTGDPAYAERFVREARAMASWRHPNIPQVYYAGSEDGISYYAMEYIQGMDLGQLLYSLAQRGELVPFGDILTIGRAVADALDYAHARGAIHRDVKPSNVLISEDDRIYLTDFGLVLLADIGTQGEVFGSPQYIAPEQARNSAETVPQTDLYSLGVILYEMLVGQLPFDDPSPVSLAFKHVTDPPPAPRQLNPDLSPEIEAVLLKALQKRPEDRYPTGKALMDALEKALLASTSPRNTQAETALPRPTFAFMPVSLEDEVPATIPMPEGSGFQLPAPPIPQPAPQKQGIPAGQAKARPSLQGIKHWPVAALGFAGLLLVLCVVALASRGLSGIKNQPAAGIAVTRTKAAAATPTRTSPASGKPTSTPALTATPTASGPQINLTLAMRKEDSLFVINSSSLDLPLAPLRFEGGNASFTGQEWGVDSLQPGQCLTLWKAEGKAKAPKESDCEIVGEQLKLSGPDKFWATDFKIYYQEALVGECKKNQEVCDLTFTISP